MMLFCERFLNNEFDVLNNDDLGQQSIYFLVRRGGPVLDAQLHVAADNFLRQEWRIDDRGDMVLREYNFTRRPLAIKTHCQLGSGKKTVYFIAMHTKSKQIQVPSFFCGLHF